MQRLTHKRSNGIKTGYWSPEKKEDLVARLAEYENTGLAPDEIGSLNEFEGSYAQKFTGACKTSMDPGGEATAGG